MRFCYGLPKIVICCNNLATHYGSQLVTQMAYIQDQNVGPIVYTISYHFLSGVLFGVRQSTLQKFWSVEKWLPLQILVADWSVDCTPKKPECPSPGKHRCHFVNSNGTVRINKYRQKISYIKFPQDNSSV